MKFEDAVNELANRYARERDPYFPTKLVIKLSEKETALKDFKKRSVIHSFISDIYRRVRYSSYSLVKKVFEKRISDREKIKSEIQSASKVLMKEKFGQPEGRDYLLTIKDYLLFAATHPLEKEEAKGYFKKYFYDDFIDSSEDAAYFIPLCTMALTGLWDIIEMDTRNLFIKKEYRQNLQEIYYRSRMNIPILIQGETGTSKSYMAEAIHLMSERRNKEFVDINCMGIPDLLLESELFGYEPGAFTGARKEGKAGLLEMANGGTVFLDELGKTPDHFQAKLLRVIDTQQFYHVGGTIPIKIDVRWVAAVQPRDIANNKIIPDLLFRLNFPYTVNMTPLRDRISILGGVPYTVIESSLNQICKELWPEPFSVSELSDLESKKEIVSSYRLQASKLISSEAIEKLSNYSYPGNYRELETILTSAAISAKMNKQSVILSEDIIFREIPEAIKQHLVEPENKVEKPIQPKVAYNVKNMKVKELFRYAEEEAKKIKAVIVEAKIKEIYRSGSNPTTDGTEEGMTLSELQYFGRNVYKTTGKKVSEIEKESIS